MPATCFFLLSNQPVSSFFCPGGGSMPAFSGKDSHVDNPAATAVANAGPLPKGAYYIVGRQSGGRLEWLWDWLKDRASHVDHDQWFALYRNDGVVDDYTFVQGVKRGNFRLHPNGRFGISEVLTIPVFLVLTRIAAIPGWLYSERGYAMLSPMFRMFGAVGVEGHEDVVVGILLVASFVIAAAIAWGSTVVWRFARRPSQ